MEDNGGARGVETERFQQRPDAGSDDMVSGEKTEAACGGAASIPPAKRSRDSDDATLDSPAKSQRVTEPVGKQPAPLTQRRLYAAATAMSDRMQASLQALAAILMLSGIGILAWHNWVSLAAYATMNTLGGGVLATGLAILASVSGSVNSGEKNEKAKFKITLLNDEERWKEDQKQLHELLGNEIWPSPELAKASAEEAQAEKVRIEKALLDQAETIKKALASGEQASVVQARLRPRTFVFDFQVSEDVRQISIKKQLEDLRDIVTFILSCASAHDSAILRLKSPGGGVADYGLAASQLLRFRKKELPLTVCIDNVAASGGYMMASTANKIVAAPFSFVGSIGVIAMLPNVAKLLKRADVDFMQFTAGKWKRTVDPFTTPTDEGLAKMREEIEQIHVAFKGHVTETRDLDIEGVATGEVFLGVDALSRGLVDELATSDEVLASRMRDSNVIEVSIAPPKEGLIQMLLGTAETVVESVTTRLWGCVGREACGRVALESVDPRVRSC